MKCDIILTNDDHINHYHYGMTIIEMDYVSCYDIRDTAIALINHIFDGAIDVAHIPMTHTITATLGGKSPYTAKFKYFIVNESGILL